jgi:PAS domain S-box-containing protein
MDKELLELVFNNVYNGIYIADGNGITIRVNRAFEEMSGISNAEIAGRSMHDLVGENNYFSGSATLLVMERKAPATVTYNTSTNRKLLVKGRPIFDDQGEIRYIINTVWDLTVITYNREIDLDTARDYFMGHEDIVACSEPMLEVIDYALKVANTDSTILITGETGVGKSIIATMVHRASPRKNHPILKLNCAAIPESLIESELFGYEAGSFTGADRKGKQGLFEIADGGTIFLDEISELPLHVQSKLLGVIQDREFVRVGGHKLCKVDVRIVAATNKDLGRMVYEGRFREDLYYRLNVVPLHVPPLRERREDIPPLIKSFVEKFNAKYKGYKTLANNLIDLLCTLPWKGNVRELENTVERLIVTSAVNYITIEQFHKGGPHRTVKESIGLKKALAEYERDILRQARQKYRTTRDIACALGISQPSVVRKLHQYRLE